jgi:SAM-dependent methyltransferase
MSIAEHLRLAAALRAACQSDPGLWNLIQAEQEWALYGDACDPLSPDAPERALKALQRAIYLEVWQRALEPMPSGARVLVAGGGTGRFAAVLAQRGLHVELVDASPEAVRRARHHLPQQVAVALGDVSDPATLARAAYDMVLAVEVACYATEPPRVMQQLRAALRPGGTLLFSVEARPGALLADRDLASPEAAEAMLGDGVVTLPGLKHVHYYTRDEARTLALEAGLVVLDVEGVCYVPDGPLQSLIDATRLDDAAHVERLMAVERRCRSHPTLREIPRAWAVTASAPQ